METSKGIAIKDFVALERRARVAFATGDAETLAEINTQLAAINMRLVERDGILCVAAIKKGELT